MNWSEVLFADRDVQRRYLERCDRQHDQLVRLSIDPRYDGKPGTFLQEGMPILRRIMCLQEKMQRLEQVAP